MQNPEELTPEKREELRKLEIEEEREDRRLMWMSDYDLPYDFVFKIQHLLFYIDELQQQIDELKNIVSPPAPESKSESETSAWEPPF